MDDHPIGGSRRYVRLAVVAFAVILYKTKAHMMRMALDWGVAISRTWVGPWERERTTFRLGNALLLEFSSV